MKTPRRHFFPLPILAVLTVFLPGCGEKSRTTKTDSLGFSSLAEKQAFLERYVGFRRQYQSLDFNIEFRDGGDGLLVSPSEWNIRVAAVVPDEEIEQWTHGLKPAVDPDTSWVAEIPGSPSDLTGFEWFEEGGQIVGRHSGERRVVYRNLAY